MKPRIDLGHLAKKDTKAIRKNKRDIYKTHKKLVPKFKGGKPRTGKQILVSTKKYYKQDSRIKKK
jgi:hypothetical protein